MPDDLLNDVRAALAGGPGTPAARFAHIEPATLDDVATCNALGDLYSRSSDMSRAYAFYRQAAALYRADGYPTKAIAVLRKASRLDGAPVEALWELGELYAGEGFKAEASGQFLRFADAARRAGDTDGVLRAYERIVALDEDNTQIIVILADMYAKSGHTNRAIVEYERAVDLLRDQGATDELELIQGKLRTLTTPPDERAEEQQPVRRRESTDLIVLPAAAADLEIVVENPAVEEPIREIAASDIIREEDEGPAAPTPEASVRPAPTLDEVIDEFKSAMSTLTEGDDPQGHYDLGIAYKEMGLLDDAVVELQAAARTEALRFKAALLLADIFADRQQPELELKQIERALTAVPDDKEALPLHYRAALGYLQLGQKRPAREHLLDCYSLDVRYRDVARRLEELRNSE